MRRLAKFLIVLVGVYCAYKVVNPTYAYRFRLTVNVETPSGPKSGSSVMEVRTVTYPAWLTLGQSSGDTSLYGDAVFIDLGASLNGKPQHVIALLVLGSRGDRGDLAFLSELVFEALWAQKPGSLNYRGSAIEMIKLPLGTKAQLSDSSIPTLVTFADLNDPKTASVVDPNNFESTFGQGFRLQSAMIEIVHTAKWPQTLNSFSGVSVTRGIDAQVPFLDTHRGRLTNVVRDMPPRFQASLFQFER